MSYFRGNSGQDPGRYARVPDGAGLPSGPRGGRQLPPDQARGALFDTRSRGPPPQAAPPPQGQYDNYGGYDRGYSNAPPPPPPSNRGAYAVTSCPTDLDGLSNRLIVAAGVFRTGEHVLLKGQYPMTIREDTTGQLGPNFIGVNAPTRQWAKLSIHDTDVPVEYLDISQFGPGGRDACLASVSLEIGYWKSSVKTGAEYSIDELNQSILASFAGMLLSKEQLLIFEFRGINFVLVVTSFSTVSDANNNASRRPPFGLLIRETEIKLSKAQGSDIKLKGSSKAPPPNAILAEDFSFEKAGIGGLDNEFSAIFRRAFASRVFPLGLVEKLGIQHVKGLLLYGPPGTGKTLMARQIGKMLKAKEPKIVNGPEILSKFVGASEENIRKLFADAEKEYKEKGDESELHIIIFDELDAICKQRGSTNSGTGVGDTVVNQLLSKMDGVEQLNNVLIIGMTNRKDMIDEALLRPGRLEVHMEISLPDEKGRFQILNIHTAKMKQNKVLDPDVDLAVLAARTKNFSGAELNGLVKSATSWAFQRHVKVGTTAGVADDVADLKVNMEDFMRALDEVKPAFGVSEEELYSLVENGIINYDESVDDLLDSAELLVKQVRNSAKTPLVSVLLHGPPGSGKTALAATIASRSEYPFIKLISPDSMVGFGEAQKVAAINKIFTDSYKSPLSVIVIDNVERLIDWVKIGSRFSNGVVQALMVLLGRRPPHGRRLLILATTSNRDMMQELEISDLFNTELWVKPVNTIDSFGHVLRSVKLLRQEEEDATIRAVEQKFRIQADDGPQWDVTGTKLSIGIKKLLGLTEMARQDPNAIGQRLVMLLELPPPPQKRTRGDY